MLLARTCCGHDMASNCAESAAHVEIKVGLGAKLDLIAPHAPARNSVARSMGGKIYDP